MDIREIDRSDEGALRRFWEIGKAAEAVARPYDFYSPWEGALARWRTPRADCRDALLGVYDAASMVGRAYVVYPEMDNTHVVSADVYVDPEHQRRGVGRMLVERVGADARAAGRRILLCEAFSPLAEDGPSLRFAAALGFTPAIEDIIKVVDLWETEAGWDSLEAEAGPRADGYRLVAWADVVPDERLEGYCALQEAFNDEAPLGELDLEREVWDEKRVRSRESQNRAGRRHELAVAAVAPDGAMAGLTEIVVSDHAPQRGFQSGTLVLRAHRGHALGLAMKLANHRAVRAAFPQCRVLMTGNAGVNVAMNAVNDRLGYRDVERCVEVQKALA